MFGFRKTGALKLFILIPNVFGTILAIDIFGAGLVGIVNVEKFSTEGSFRKRVYNYVFMIILMAGIVLGIVSSLAVIASWATLCNFGPKIKSELKDYLEDEMNQYDGSNSTKNSIIIQIQYHLKCCGVNGYTDWEVQEKASKWSKRK